MKRDGLERRVERKLNSCRSSNFRQRNTCKALIYHNKYRNTRKRHYLFRRRKICYNFENENRQIMYVYVL
jgi:hypothetical protein